MLFFSHTDSSNTLSLILVAFHALWSLDVVSLTTFSFVNWLTLCALQAIPTSPPARWFTSWFRDSRCCRHTDLQREDILHCFHRKSRWLVCATLIRTVWDCSSHTGNFLPLLLRRVVRSDFPPGFPPQPRPSRASVCRSL
jgi:hypothetical protein